METHLIENRQIRIFISSTFNDMQRERDYLMKQVFPILRQEAANRNVSLIELDLRWGITEEEAKSGKVLEICLNEIENSHPFFIGLLGDRYGWQPDISQLECNRHLEERYPWLKKDLKDGLSVTEIEMQYGVLRSKRPLNASFYLKRQSDKIARPMSLEEKIASHKLYHLKESILQHPHLQSHEYSSLEELGKWVTMDFRKLLNQLFPEENLSPIEKERLAQNAYLRQLCSAYIPVEKNFKALDRFLGSREEMQLAVVGESGAGKSALLANWINSIKNHTSWKIIYHFIGSTAANNDYVYLLQRLTAEIAELFQLELSPTDREKDKVAQFARILHQLPQNSHLLIVLDALNQLDTADYGHMLAWLPPFPPQVKLLVSTLPDDETRRAVMRRNFSIYQLEELGEAERIQMISVYLQQHGKRLTADQMQRIVRDPQHHNTLVLKTFLNQLIVFGKHEELNQRIDYYLSATSIPDFFQRVLLATEDDYGHDFVKHVLGLIALSRDGMSESELIAITKCTPLQWSQFYCGFVGHFLVRNGLINFAHSYIREAVKTRYLGNSLQTKAWRHEIVEQVKPNFDERSMSEMPFQYEGMDENMMLDIVLLCPLTFLYLYHEQRSDLIRYWRKLQRDEETGYTLAEMTEELDEWNLDPEMTALFHECLAHFASTDIIDLDLAQKCEKKALEYALHHYGEDNPMTAYNYMHMGNVHTDLGNFETALKYQERALEIFRRYYGERHIDVANSYAQIALAQNSLGNYAEAIRYEEKALQLRLQLLGHNHVDTASSYHNLGCSFKESGRYLLAEEYFKKALHLLLFNYGENEKVGMVYKSISNLYTEMGRIDDALSYNQQAINLFVNVYGDLNPMSADAYDERGELYFKMRKYNDARLYLNYALNLRKKLYPKGHSKLAKSYSNLGVAYQAMGQFEQALEYLRTAHHLKLEIFGEGHPDVGVSYNNLATTLFNMGKLDEALPYFQKAQKMLIAAFGEAHPMTLKILSNIGTIYCRQGRYHEAYNVHNHVMDLMMDTFDTPNPSVARTFSNIGETCYTMGNYQLALENYSNALDLQLDLLGEEHIDTAGTYYNMAMTYIRLGQLQRALQSAQKSLSIHQRLLGENSANSGHILILTTMAQILLLMNEKTEAINYARTALTICQKQLGDEAALTKNCKKIMNDILS